MRIGRRVYKDLAVKPRRQKSSIAGASRHPTSTPTCAIGRRVYKDLAIIGFSMNQPQNLSLIHIERDTHLSLIHIERDTPNEKHTRARDGSIRAIKPPSRARRAIQPRRR